MTWIQTALDDLELHNSILTAAKGHPSDFNVARLSPVWGQPGLTLRPLYHLTTSIDRSSLLLISISPYFSMTPNRYDSESTALEIVGCE